jgi:hypothetical protein
MPITVMLNNQDGHRRSREPDREGASPAPHGPNRVDRADSSARRCLADDPRDRAGRDDERGRTRERADQRRHDETGRTVAVLRPRQHVVADERSVAYEAGDHGRRDDDRDVERTDHRERQGLAPVERERGTGDLTGPPTAYHGHRLDTLPEVRRMRNRASRATSRRLIRIFTARTGTR